MGLIAWGGMVVGFKVKLVGTQLLGQFQGEFSRSRWAKVNPGKWANGQPNKTTDLQCH
jgi:hypothetical protein